MTNLVPRRASKPSGNTQTLGFIISDYCSYFESCIFLRRNHHENFLSIFGAFIHNR